MLANISGPNEQTVGAAMSVKLTIIEQMELIAREHGKILAPLKENLALAECGRDSLGFAVLVARLEDALGIDPITDAEDACFPVRSEIS